MITPSRPSGPKRLGRPAHLPRRVLLQACAASLAWPLAGPAGAQQAPRAGATPELRTGSAPALWPELTIFIPAGTGGGWDQTGRAVGGVLQATGLVGQVRYENLGGKAGTLGLAAFAERYKANPNALMVMGMVMLGGIAMHRPAVDLTQLHPVAELTSDYMVVAVPASSPLRSLKDLAASLRDANYRATVVGGSAGGVDHMLLGMMLRATQAAPERFTYQATASGAQALQALTGGQAQLGISGYSEFREAIQSGQIRALAVSGPRGEFGLPALRDGGINTTLLNWRGLCAPGGLTAAQVEALQALIGRLVATPEWREAVKANQWFSTYRGGASLRQFIDTEQATARIVVNLLKLGSS